MGQDSSNTRPRPHRVCISLESLRTTASALAFAKRFQLRGGLRVFATGRTDNKDTDLDPTPAFLSIETFTLDVTSESSLADAVAKVQELTKEGGKASMDILRGRRPGDALCRLAVPPPSKHARPRKQEDRSPCSSLHFS